MIPRNYKAFGGGGETTMNPLALAILIAGLLAMCLLPKRFLLIPFVLLALLMPGEEQIVILGLHFSIMRVLIVGAWCRCAFYLKCHKLTLLDMMFIAWVITSTCAYTLLWEDVGALVFKLGFAFNALGIYFLFRQLLCGRVSAIRFVRILVIACVFIAFLMVYESATGHNLLSIIGGPGQAELRHERFRSQGPFAHPIIAGTFGAILMPIFVSLWVFRDCKTYAVSGLIATTFIMFTSASSTPVAAFCGGIVALLLWPMRGHMRLVRWGIVGTLIVLQIVMNAPVWALLTRFDAVGGSSGWHRFMLIDQFFRHVGDWWLTGTTANSSWGFDMWDRANWYVQVGIDGGIVTLFLFLSVIVLGFRAVSKGCLDCKRDGTWERFAWGLGCSLFASVVSFMGISLSDQSIIAWYGLLALLSALSAGAMQSHYSLDYIIK